MIAIKKETANCPLYLCLISSQQGTRYLQVWSKYLAMMRKIVNKFCTDNRQLKEIECVGKKSLTQIITQTLYFKWLVNFSLATFFTQIFYTTFKKIFRAWDAFEVRKVRFLFDRGRLWSFWLRTRYMKEIDPCDKMGNNDKTAIKKIAPQGARIPFIPFSMALAVTLINCGAFVSLIWKFENAA